MTNESSGFSQESEVSPDLKSYIEGHKKVVLEHGSMSRGLKSQLRGKKGTYWFPEVSTGTGMLTFDNSPGGHLMFIDANNDVAEVELNIDEIASLRDAATARMGSHYHSDYLHQLGKELEEIFQSGPESFIPPGAEEKIKREALKRHNEANTERFDL